MFFYALVFILLGVIFKFLLSERVLYPAILITTLFWAFVFGPWAVLTFFELVIGVIIAESMKSNTKDNSQDAPSLYSARTKSYVAPKLNRNMIEKMKGITSKEDDIDIEKLNDAYRKELNKNNW